MNKKILLFAFRKSHKLFFENFINNCEENLFEIKESKKSFKFSFSSIRDFKKIDIQPACSFAIDEFYAKTEIKIPIFILESFFKVMAFVNFLRYHMVLSRNYEKILIWNGGKFRQLIAIEIAKKICNTKIYYFENGLLPNTNVFDSKGINFNNSVPRDIKFFENYNNNLDLPKDLIQRTAKNKSKFSVEKTTLPKKYIFVPFQVDYDTQIITNSKWLKNMRQLFDVIEYLARNSDIKFVIKEHPSSGKNYPDLHEKAEKLNNLSFKNGYSTQELIQKSSAVITINSTVGIESLLFHKKVIVLGDAFYNIKNITTGVKDKNKLLELINNIDNLKLNVELIDKFLKYLYYEYLIRKDDNIYKTFIKKLID
ncbi:MAG: hypothetical protein U9Q33_07510 [Campylobacterota bacterium]|nr:hypothetical protein [Campylobacterota bacterium]